MPCERGRCIKTLNDAHFSSSTAFSILVQLTVSFSLFSIIIIIIITLARKYKYTISTHPTSHIYSLTTNLISIMKTRIFFSSITMLTTMHAIAATPIADSGNSTSFNPNGLSHGVGANPGSESSYNLPIEPIYSLPIGPNPVAVLPPSAPPASDDGENPDPVITSPSQRIMAQIPIRRQIPIRTAKVLI